MTEIGKRNAVNAVGSDAVAWNSLSSTIIHICFAKGTVTQRNIIEKNQDEVPGERATRASGVPK